MQSISRTSREVVRSGSISKSISRNPGSENLLQVTTSNPRSSVPRLGLDGRVDPIELSPPANSSGDAGPLGYSIDSARAAAPPVTGRRPSPVISAAESASEPSRLNDDSATSL